MSPLGTDSLAGAGGDAVKRKGRTTEVMTPTSEAWPMAVRQTSLPSMAGVEYHSFLRAATVWAALERMAAR